MYSDVRIGFIDSIGYNYVIKVKKVEKLKNLLLKILFHKKNVNVFSIN